jgi:hypothetical protein
MKRCMLNIIFLFPLILLANCCVAEYRPPTLCQMILYADKIIYGKIEELDSIYFYVRSFEKKDSSLIKIRRFVNWTCAYRDADYEKGQISYLFLEKRDADLYIMSPGGEGEFIVARDTVSIPFQLLPNPYSWIGGKNLIDSLKNHYISNQKMVRRRPLNINHFNLIVKEFRNNFALQKLPKLSCASFSVVNPNYSLLDSDEIFYLLYQNYLLLKAEYCDLR